jgi:hypothetical protein
LRSGFFFLDLLVALGNAVSMGFLERRKPFDNDPWRQ